MTWNPHLEAWRNDDGGFGPVAGAPSEPEATAMVALAFDDGAAHAWLVDAQQANGSIGLQVGSVTRDVTAIGALALPPGDARERALDHLMTVFGSNGDAEYKTHGWPWTDDTHGWTEPTAWGLMATRLRPNAVDRSADALAFFRERECSGGGWNYGAPSTLGFGLGPFVQTTAIALLGLGDDEPDLAARGLRYLEETWRSESDGELTLATALCALRRAGSRDAREAAAALARFGLESVGDTIALSWLAFAHGAPGPWEVS
jgi:hypothetical protein